MAISLPKARSDAVFGEATKIKKQESFQDEIIIETFKFG